MTVGDTLGDDRLILVRDFYTTLSPHILSWNSTKTTVCLISRCINARAYYTLSMEVFLIKFHEHVHGRHSTKREFSILLPYTQRKHNIIFYFFYRHGCLTKRKYNRMNDNSENVILFVCLYKTYLLNFFLFDTYYDDDVLQQHDMLI